MRKGSAKRRHISSARVASCLDPRSNLTPNSPLAAASDLFLSFCFWNIIFSNPLLLSTPSHLYPGMIPNRFGGGAGPLYFGFAGPRDLGLVKNAAAGSAQRDWERSVAFICASSECLRAAQRSTERVRDILGHGWRPDFHMSTNGQVAPSAGHGQTPSFSQATHLAKAVSFSASTICFFRTISCRCTSPLPHSFFSRSLLSSSRFAARRSAASAAASIFRPLASR